MSSSTEVASSLARRIAAIPDVAMRVAYVRHELGRMAPELVADVIAIAANLTETRVPPAPELLLAISLALADDAANETRLAALSVAASRGQRDVMLLLARRMPGDDDYEEDERNAPDLGGRPITLGERKSLARTRDRSLLMRVLRDPHPAVIDILLGNPHVTESDVVRVAARRPASPALLRKIFRSTRWIVRYRIRRTLTLNPYTPLDISLALLCHLNSPDRALVRRSRDLREELRRAAGEDAPEPLLH